MRTEQPGQAPRNIQFITGASRGLGLEITKTVLASGNQVVTTVRNRPELLAAELPNENLFVVTKDVSDEE